MWNEQVAVMGERGGSESAPGLISANCVPIMFALSQLALEALKRSEEDRMC